MRQKMAKMTPSRSETSRMGAQKKQRTCIMCRKEDSKGSLLRLVRTPEGDVLFDRTGRMNGRGAYVCSVACLEKALGSKRLEQALRTKITEEQRADIIADVTAALSSGD